MNTRRSEQLRAPRHLVRGSTDDRTGRTAPVAQESGRSRRRPHETDRDKHEHTRPARRPKSAYTARGRPMVRPAGRMRHFSITHARAATRIVSSGPRLPVVIAAIVAARDPAQEADSLRMPPLGPDLLTARSRCNKSSDTPALCWPRNSGESPWRSRCSSRRESRSLTGGGRISGGHILESRREVA